ncbi:CU044_2847 family protein [Streptomyces rimosus]|uniref:CU044_2847 family protein n=1 Tax=Streptomyces rimosus TaxID=1927 RepID=UPI0004C16F39|nr:CU044_2847 family protein [Streptomyces rimosus]
MASQVVSYALDDETVVRFEVEPTDDWHPVAAGDVVGRVRDAAGPAVDAARTVLHRVTELQPDQVQVKFGLKVNGTANWIVAKAATEANFEISLTWEPRPGADGDAAQE